MLILCASVVLPAAAFATPAEEITQAVAVNGAPDILAAQPKPFLKAFTAVAVRTQPRELPDYVLAAVNLRPELAPDIVSVAVKVAVKRWEDKPSALCALIDRIVRAAIAANPDAVVAVAKAAATASPHLRHCVVNAAISAAPMARDAILRAAAAQAVPFPFLTFSASGHSGFSFSPPTLNPANISDLGNSEVNSPEQPPSP